MPGSNDFPERVLPGKSVAELGRDSRARPVPFVHPDDDSFHLRQVRKGCRSESSGSGRRVAPACSVRAHPIANLRDTARFWVQPRTSDQLAGARLDEEVAPIFLRVEGRPPDRKEVPLRVRRWHGICPREPARQLGLASLDCVQERVEILQSAPPQLNGARGKDLR